MHTETRDPIEQHLHNQLLCLSRHGQPLGSRVSDESEVRAHSNNQRFPASSRCSSQVHEFKLNRPPGTDQHMGGRGWSAPYGCRIEDRVRIPGGSSLRSGESGPWTLAFSHRVEDRGSHRSGSGEESKRALDEGHVAGFRR